MKINKLKLMSVVSGIFILFLYSCREDDGATDPVNTSAGANNKRVRRGGSWNYHASTLLSYARASDFEHRGNNHFGFRIVKK